MFYRILLPMLICILSWKAQPTVSSRILFLSPFTSKSHAIFYESLLRGLVNNNHSIRILSNEKVLGNHFGDLVYETTFSSFKPPAFINFVEERKQKKEHLLAFKIHDAGVDVCRDFLKSPGTLKILEEAKEKPFDVLLTGPLMYECAVPFAHILSIPRILISSASMLPWVDYSVRNPLQWSYAPNLYLTYTDTMTFKERFYNAAFSLALILHREWAYYPKLDSVIHQYLGPDIPTMSNMDPEVSLVLVNSDPSIDYPKANQPNVIQLGGLHLGSPQPLTKDLQEFMDGSGDAGIVLFSMGSVLKGTELSEEDVLSIAQAFQAIPQRVLWKWDLDKPPHETMPPNIRLEKWLPQQSILAHPKTKAFITHGGLGSCLEAVYYGVPIIGIPIFADQEFNVVRSVHDGSGVLLDISNLTKLSLLDAIGRVTKDSRFKQAMQRRSTILRDKFWDPVELGVYYIEYVIRHKGAPHLHPAASKLFWFQLNHLDVILFVLGLLIATFVLIVNILSNIKHYVLYNQRKPKKMKKR